VRWRIAKEKKKTVLTKGGRMERPSGQEEKILKEKLEKRVPGKGNVVGDVKGGRGGFQWQIVRRQGVEGRKTGAM